jgi:hypothetical protein
MSPTGLAWVVPVCVLIPSDSRSYFWMKCLWDLELAFNFPTIRQYLHRGIIPSGKLRYCRQCGARHSSSFPLSRGPSVSLQRTAVSKTLIHAIFKKSTGNVLRPPDTCHIQQTCCSLHTSEFLSLARWRKVTGRQFSRKIMPLSLLPGILAYVCALEDKTRRRNSVMGVVVQAVLSCTTEYGVTDTVRFAVHVAKYQTVLLHLSARSSTGWA